MPKVPEEAMMRAVELLAEANTRAERAEAERDAAAAALEEMGVELDDTFQALKDVEAERDALRNALEKITSHGLQAGAAEVARAALNPSPTDADQTQKRMPTRR